ncbi:MAG: SRPBCC domain-containing protein [Pseudomonadota bacterium]
MTTPTDLTIEVSRAFAAPVTRLWSAYTDAMLLPRWFQGPAGLTMADCTMDVRRGGSFEFRWRLTTGAELSAEGFFTHVTPQKRLTYEITYQGSTAAPVLRDLKFSANEPGSTLTICSHYDTQEQRDAALAKPIAQNSAPDFARLDDLIATRH